MFKVQTHYRNQFWEWCQKNDIVCEYMGTTSYTSAEGTDTWYIGCTEHRLLAIMTWP